MNIENIVVKKLAYQDLETLMSWASNEGWNPGKNDAKVFCISFAFFAFKELQTIIKYII